MKKLSMLWCVFVCLVFTGCSLGMDENSDFQEKKKSLVKKSLVGTWQGRITKITYFGSTYDATLEIRRAPFSGQTPLKKKNIYYGRLTTVRPGHTIYTACINMLTLHQDNGTVKIFDAPTVKTGCYSQWVTTTFRYGDYLFFRSDYKNNPDGIQYQKSHVGTLYRIE